MYSVFVWLLVEYSRNKLLVQPSPS